MNSLIVSPSPHIHSHDSVKRNMYGVLLALMPAIAASFYFFGIGALIVLATSVVSACLFEYLIQRFLFHKELSLTNGSAIITGTLLAMNLPSNCPVMLVVIGNFVAIGIAKMAFGGLGNNPFNPALVGRVFFLISFPVQMTSWPVPISSRLQYVDAVTGATPLGIVKEGLKKGETLEVLMNKVPSSLDLLWGNCGGSAGEVAAIALLAGLAFLLIRRIITWHIPVSILASVALFSGILHLYNPSVYAHPVFHLLTGGVLLGAIFMATDYVTSPMSSKGMLLFGAGIGVITVLIRVFGSYPEGVSFAILIMNGFTPVINRYLKPQRFSPTEKHRKLND
jgi:electron transport complex protein RnfD